MVKCIKTYLNYIDTPELPYKDFCRAAWDIQRQVRAAKNLAITELWECRKWENRVKLETGAYPDKAERYGQKEGQYIYRLMCDNAPDLQTGNIAALQRSVEQRMTADLKEVLRGDKSIASFKADQPIELHNNSIRIEDDGLTIKVYLSLFSTKKRTDLGMKNGVVAFTVFRPGDGAETILHRCAAGQYKYGAGKLQYDRKKRMWMLSLSYSFEAEQNDLDPEKICGVDLGVASPVYCAVSDGYARLNFPGGKIEQFRAQMERRRKGLLKSRPYCEKGSRGHGYHTRVRIFDTLSGKVARFRDAQNHLMSRAVVDFAVKNECGKIQMEDLSGIWHLSTFLHNWPYYDLQSKIEQKAKEAGIEVVKVKPQYTSQRCHKCGHISSENRKTQADFECVKCGYKTNADFNAAKNIATKDIEKIITKALGANPEPTEVS